MKNTHNILFGKRTDDELGMMNGDLGVVDKQRLVLASKIIASICSQQLRLW
jgi:hypothetical protein